MKTLYTDNTILTQDKKFTYLQSDASSGSTTIEVQSIVGFSTNQILCIGEIGSEKTEIVKTHDTTAPSGNTITLASALTFDHPQDTKVYIIDFDQVEISWASTTGGDKSVLATIDIQADQKETIYKDTTKSSGYYFVRFKDSINTLYSDYSDPIPYSGYGDNTVWAIKDRALKATNEKIGDLITHEYLNESLWEARREYHKAPGKRPFRKKFNVDLGNVTTGMYKIAVPSDLEKPYTAENIFGIRIGTSENLKYYDKKEWDEDYRNVAHTTLASDYTVGDATITLTNSRDFDDSGSIKIGDDVIEYSANNRSTGVLTVSKDGSSNHSAGDDVWQNVSYGLPTKYTVFSEDGTNYYIYFNRPISSDYEGQNIWIDYYRTLPVYDSDADELDEPEYDMFVNYLAWKIKKRKNEGLQPLSDPDYTLWLAKKNDALKKERLGQKIRFRPKIDHLL